MSLNSLKIRRNARWLLRLTALACSLLFSSIAFAQTLNGYCITKIGYKPQSKPTVSSIDEPVPVNVTVDGKLFRIVVKDNKYLIVMDENNVPLNQVNVGQKNDQIYEVVLGKNGWLWIGGGERGYMVKLDLAMAPPTLGEPVQIPVLESSSCSVFSKWWGHCIFKARGDYSPLLDRVFVAGHHVTLMGRGGLTSYEVIAGQAKLLPVELQDASLIGGRRHAGAIDIGIYEDLPNLNGVLFKGQNNAAFFYDGVKVTPLLIGEPPDVVMNESLKNYNRWYVETTRFSKRNFLTNYAAHDLLKVKPFIIEIKSGPTLVPISIPDELSEGWLKFFDFPKDKRLFGIVKNRVTVELNGELRTIAIARAPSSITGTQSADGAITLNVYNPTTQASIDYLLVNTSTTEKCVAIPNTEKPIELGNDN